MALRRKPVEKRPDVPTPLEMMQKKVQPGLLPPPEAPDVTRQTDDQRHSD